MSSNLCWNPSICKCTQRKMQDCADNSEIAPDRRLMPWDGGVFSIILQVSGTSFMHYGEMRKYQTVSNTSHSISQSQRRECIMHTSITPSRISATRWIFHVEYSVPCYKHAMSVLFTLLAANKKQTDAVPITTKQTNKNKMNTVHIDTQSVVMSLHYIPAVN